MHDGNMPYLKCRQCGIDIARSGYSYRGYCVICAEPVVAQDSARDFLDALRDVVDANTMRRVCRDAHERR